jgi:hypothetical protein
MADGNVAFKVTWVYGQNGPFTSPCTPEGRDNNIRRQKRVWCSQPECPCNQLFRRGNKGMVAEDDPCYDAMIFKSWSFGGGVYHTGERQGSPIPLKYVQPGKLAFFTSRNIDMPESERIIIGCYKIAGMELDEKDGFMVQAMEGSGLRVPDFNNAPRYWDFYSQEGGPRWDTGLFRYLTDRVAQAMYKAVQDAVRKG